MNFLLDQPWLRRTWPVQLGIGAAAIAAVGLATSHLLAPVPVGIVTGLLGLAIVGGCAVASRHVDEAVREAHKSAWLWGGCFGLAFLLGVTAWARAVGPAFSFRDLQVGQGDPGVFLSGILVCLGLQFVGYAVAWALWWLRRQ